MENNSLKLEVSKDFSCSKDQLYKAWTDPESLKQWWKPLGKHLVNVENNLTPGGTVRYEFENNSLVIDGTYEKADQQQLTYTWNWKLADEPVRDAEYTLDVHFEGDADHSSISVVQNGFENEESITPHKEGWEHGLEQLKEFVSGGSSAGTDSSGATGATAQTGKPEVSGYNETPEQQKVAGG
ncbi:SRPBCC domain-containing protein [Segetibacter sp. 3557_3]|uniref:SRPBCC family protein n=1 Tax=Segetibacter sp. 3557_3 TaxID=2547429 RepID=UPI001404BEFE|nr:SRPBCC domain-containing protein [Segetibacter sp. 3557_3]